MAILTQKQQDALPDSAFAYVNKKGDRKLPIHDPDHVRAALARFDQTIFDSDSDKATAKTKVLAAAKKFGIKAAASRAYGPGGIETRMWNDIEFRILDTGENIVPVEGHAVDYGKWYDVFDGIGPTGKFRECMMPGAAREVAKSDDVIFDVNHQGLALGRTGAAGTLTLTDTSRGLHFRWLADGRSAAHTDTLLAIQRGDLKACSVAMGQLTDSWNSAQSERQVFKIGKLYGLGPVNHPASPTTDIGLAQRGIYYAEFIHDGGASPRGHRRLHTDDLRRELEDAKLRSAQREKRGQISDQLRRIREEQENAAIVAELRKRRQREADLEALRNWRLHTDNTTQERTLNAISSFRIGH